MTLPAGYARTRVGSVRAFALAEAGEWLEAALPEGGLYAWAGSRSGEAPLRGRGDVRVVAAPVKGAGGGERWAVRHYRRGGVAARLLGDRYARIGVPRPERELAVSVEARARGVPTPRVIAGAVYPGPLFYRADLVTDLIPEATSLAESLFALEPGEERGECLRSAGRLVRSLEAAGVLHVDLNAHNVLLSRSAHGWVAHAVDLDRCRVLPTTASSPGGTMRRRLDRSLRKLGRAHGCPLGPADWEALADALAGRA